MTENDEIGLGIVLGTILAIALVAGLLWLSHLFPAVPG